jgi:cyclic beta-1,2-glucan synthetase
MTSAPRAGRSTPAKLQQALERDAWDGAWYRRAYFDDGTRSARHLHGMPHRFACTELERDFRCRRARAARAAHAGGRGVLGAPGDDLILLFTPPFDKTPHDPGYIKGYLPGVRENGGQYTHAAVWCAIAMAALARAMRRMSCFAC